MAYIKKIKEGTETIYPATIPQAVVDPTSGKTVRTELDEKATSAELSQLAGEVNLFKEESNLKDAVQGAKIKDIENVLSTANFNQSAQLSVSGRKTISLPKNASNGGMSVKLEGLTAENLVVNGDFRNGTTGWGQSNVSNFNVSNREAILLTNGQSVAYVQAPAGNVKANEKYYAYVILKTTSSQVALVTTDLIVGGLVKYHSGNGVYQRISGIYTQTIDKNIILRIRDYRTTGIDNVYIKENGFINLTATFGAGNEPTEEQCDIIFSDYFEGVKSFEPTGRVRSVDASGENPTHLYLTAPELRSNGTVKDEIRKGANGYELVKRISEIDGTVLTTPVITPISHGGILNSAENGTVYHEPIIADAGVYDTKMDILLTDYPIATIEEIIKHENGADTYLNVATAVISVDGLSFTHPDLASGDLVLFTYAFDKESTNGNITATFYDSNVVKIDTVTGKAYRINEVVTNGVLTRTLTEV